MIKSHAERRLVQAKLMSLGERIIRHRDTVTTETVLDALSEMNALSHDLMLFAATANASLVAVTDIERTSNLGMLKLVAGTDLLIK